MWMMTPSCPGSGTSHRPRHARPALGHPDSPATRSSDHPSDTPPAKETLMPPRSLLARLTGLLIAAPAATPAQGQGELAKAPPPAGLLAPQAATSLAARVALLEGPACDGD